MHRRRAQLLQKQTKVKVIAQAYNHQKENIVWFITLATAAVAGVFYFFSLFFGFTGWCALAED
jgi:hypothetical protein